MALGHRNQERQASFWIPVDELPRSAGHVFYGQLHQLLREAGFDEFVERLCEPDDHDRLGRPGIPPGVYFRLLLVGYFEGLGSQRGIAWRCADSLSWREFLGTRLGEETPDHSSLTRVRDRLAGVRPAIDAGSGPNRARRPTDGRGNRPLRPPTPG